MVIYDGNRRSHVVARRLCDEATWRYSEERLLRSQKTLARNDIVFVNLVGEISFSKGSE